MANVLKLLALSFALTTTTATTMATFGFLVAHSFDSPLAP